MDLQSSIIGLRVLCLGPKCNFYPKVAFMLNQICLYVQLSSKCAFQPLRAETNGHLEVVWIQCVLSDMIQNSSLIIQNWWGPRKKFCLDSITWFWSSCFGDSITQKTEWWSPKMKTDFTCFQIDHPWLSGSSVYKLPQWAPSTSALSHLHSA